jgi:hypothetical protein
LSAKAALYLAMKEAAISQAALARALQVDEKEVRRLLDPHHPSKLPQMEEALHALGKRLMLSLQPTFKLLAAPISHRELHRSWMKNGRAAVGRAPHFMASAEMSRFAMLGSGRRTNPLSLVPVHPVGRTPLARRQFLARLGAGLFRPSGADRCLDMMLFFRRWEHSYHPERFDPQLAAPTFGVIQMLVFLILDRIARLLQRLGAWASQLLGAFAQ